VSGPLLRPFRPSDDAGVDAVVARAFGRRAEADLVRALRHEARPFVEWVAEGPSGVVGHIALSPVTPERVAPGVRALGLAPLSVEPGLQRSGIGQALGRAALADCAVRGVGLVFVLGHAAYYPLLGFRPEMILAAHTISLVYQYWIHTELVGRLGVLEWLLNTPSHHRVHHGSNPQYIDKNHGGIFIVWDRLFGTFEPEVERPVYGLTKPLEKRDVVHVAFNEWIAIARDLRRARTLRGRLNVVFGRTGTDYLACERGHEVIPSRAWSQ